MTPRLPHNLMNDLHYGLRLWRKQPGFTAIAIVTLSLGIGANTAIFSVAYATLLEPLPYTRPSELVLLWSSFQKMGAARRRVAQDQTTQPIARRRGRHLGRQRHARRRAGTGANQTGFGDAQLFHVPGAPPLLERVFTVEDETAQDGVRPLILSHALWQRRYGGDPGIVGWQVQLGGGSATVVGVMPREFQ